MRAEILTYSRARGLFAGVSLEGSTLRPGNDANEALYGRKIGARAIIRGSEAQDPQTLNRYTHVISGLGVSPDLAQIKADSKFGLGWKQMQKGRDRRRMGYIDSRPKGKAEVSF